jgi:AcrR family transcriptional regulator
MGAAAGQRPITGDRAARIVDAMRVSVARRGVPASTFDHVAREARVSRGLLHYHFGTKERLLAEVVRRDCELRMQALDERLAGARSADEVVDGLVASMRAMVLEDPAFVTVVFELFALSRRNAEIAGEFAGLLRRTREHLAGLLRAKHDAGVLRLQAQPEAVADVLLSLADGVALRMLAEGERDFEATVRAGMRAVRALLD